MGNILLQDNGKPKGNSLLDMISQLKKAGPSATVFNQAYNNDPRFRQFADSLRGMTPEQAFKQNGLDFGKFSRFKW